MKDWGGQPMGVLLGPDPTILSLKHRAQSSSHPEGCPCPQLTGDGDYLRATLPPVSRGDGEWGELMPVKCPMPLCRAEKTGSEGKAFVPTFLHAIISTAFKSIKPAHCLQAHYYFNEKK